MIAESEIMQFSTRFDSARDACVAALYASHIVCTGVLGRRVAFCINQLVFAEAMKLACHFVFDVWIPPWTEIPNPKAHPDLKSYMRQMNEIRLRALNALSFGQICLETNAVYKLCTAACLPDICPHVVDTQGHFACKALAYVLTQIHVQELRSTLRNGTVLISSIDKMSFSESVIKGGSEVAHEMLHLCARCKVPSREGDDLKPKNYTLCTYTLARNQNCQGRDHSNLDKRVGSLTVHLEAVYNILALYAPGSHSGFWNQLGGAMLDVYSKGDFEQVNAFGQCSSDGGDTPSLKLTFTLDFNEDPVHSLILDTVMAFEPLNELMFTKCVLGGEVFQCSAPLYCGGIIK